MLTNIVSPGSEIRQDLAPLLYQTGQTPNSYIAERVLTPVPVQERNFRLSTLSAGALLIRQNSKRAEGAAAVRVNAAVGRISGEIEEWAAESPVTPTLSQGTSVDEQERAATLLAGHTILIGQDRELASTLTNETTFPPSGSTGATLVTPWSNASGGTPRDNILTGFDNLNLTTGAQRFGMVINYKTYLNLCRSANLRGDLATASNRPGMIPVNELAALIAGDADFEIIVAGGVSNANPQGGTVSMNRLWSDTYAFIYARPSIEGVLDGSALGYTFKWTGPAYSPGVELSSQIAAQGASIVVEQYNDPEHSQRIIRARDFKDMVINSTLAGYLIKSV